MRIYINRKSADKSKGELDRTEENIKEQAYSLRSLIEELVTQGVMSFNQRASAEPMALTSSQIEAQAKEGKISFGTRYADALAGVDSSLQTAYGNFQDGLFRIFVDDVECLELDEQVDIRENSTITIIRLIMLSGLPI